ncbi:MAG TPA: extracellular solute-binding protein [Burkholderiaceae bacterium]|nr:extracellular solute-binding protein [Burkholderiaceae bacterium]
MLLTRRQTLFATALPACLSARADDGAPSAGWVHGWAAYDEPTKYGSDFSHFGYVNPDAPKGGTLVLHNPDRRSSFDKFNPFTIRGNAPAGVSMFMLETLATGSSDEPASVYGLLAEALQVAPDRSSVAFRLHPKARFINGDPVLAADVKHSFEMLVSKYAAPGYRIVFAGVERVVVIDERTVRFDLKDRSVDTVTSVCGLPVFSRKWGGGKRFDEIVGEYPIVTGPYEIALAESGRRIEFKRRADYWAANLPVRRGFYNFDRIVYRYYQDGAVALEAFKAGEFDLIQEYSARRWARQHAGPKWRDRRIRKEVFPSGLGQGLQSYLINLRRDIFKDRRVRQALDLAYDFEQLNRYQQYKRAYSLFSNSPFAAEGLPGAGELKLLEPFRMQLPPEVFGPAYRPPRTDTGPNALRENLRRARDLLAEAGWKVDSEGTLRNAKGEPFTFEYLSPEEGAGRSLAPWQHNLEKLGITCRIRQVDFALYRKRLEVYDFDMITIRSGDFTLPSPLDFLDTFGSKSADEPGAGNLRGVKSPAVDAILAAMNRAQTMDALRDACRALDRIVMHEHWQVPDLYGANFRVSYWDRFERPAALPLYYGIDSESSGLPWPITTWWLKASERNAERRRG